jgi:sortase A
MRRRSFRLLLILVVGLVLSAGGAVWLDRNARTFAENPQFKVAAEQVLNSTTTTTAAPAPAVAAPTPAAQGTGGVGRPRPMSVPKNSYAPEPIQEIGTIEIPKIGLVSKIYHGITLRNIDLGPSHWPGTAFPGENGNAVFAGHRVTHTHPFRNIDQLAQGDLVYFTINGQRTTYVMTGSLIVQPKDTWIADQTDTPTATLFGCHPPGSARFRYVVKLALVQS